MKKKIFCISIILVSFFVTSNAQINAGNDTLICSSSPVHLHATTTGVLGTTSYTFDSIPFNPWPYIGTVPYGSGNSGTNMPFTNCDDCVTDSAIDLGFSFCFLGQVYTQCYIGTNGWITFSPNQPTTYTSDTIPNINPSVPRNCIMGPWQDWYPGGGGNGGFVRDTTLGVTPNRVFIVSWIDCPMFQCTTTYGTFQIAIYETTNVIENYLEVKPNCLTWAGGTGTQGVHNLDGTAAFVVPGRNSTQWIANNEGTTFIPSGITWYDNGTVVGYGADIDVTPVTTTSYIAEVDLCDGTTSYDTVTVTVALGSVQYAQGSTTCPQAPDGYAVFIPLDTTTWNYTWENASGSNLGSGNVNQVSDTLFNLLAGQYTLTLTNSLGCIISHDYNIQTTPIILDSTNYAQINTSCPSVADGAAILSPQDTGTWAFVWLDAQNNILGTGSLHQSTDTLNNIYSGQYSVVLTNAYGCTVSHNYTITADPFNASFIVSSAPHCDGAAVNFNNTSVGSIDNYSWSFGDGNSATTVNANHIYSPVGNYTIVLQISNGIGCIDTATASVTVLPNIIADFSFIPLEGCAGAPINFTDKSNQFPVSWNWNFGDQSSASIDNPTHTFNQDGTFSVSLTVTDSLCGIDTKTLPVVIHFVPDVNIGNDTAVCKYEHLYLNAGYPGTTYLWSTGETTQIITPPMADHDTYYSVIVNNYGCLGYDTMLAVIDCDVTMPSAFSPNGDNVNDIFRPLGFRITQYDMTIFNRWGEKIYEINAPNASLGWDGKFNGEDQEVGVYVYYMNATFINGEKKSINGNVTLLR